MREIFSLLETQKEGHVGGVLSYCGHRREGNGGANGQGREIDDGSAMLLCGKEFCNNSGIVWIARHTMPLQSLFNLGV